MNDSEFQKFIWLSSVPLVQLNAQRLPIAIASGCLIDYFDKRVLLTVSHATGNQGNWAIQLRYVSGKGTETYQLGAMNFLTTASLSSKPKPTFEDIDFSYVEVPPATQGYRQEIDALTGLVKLEILITAHKPSLEDTPNSDDEYGFCGMVLPTLENHSNQIFLGGELRVYSGLKFLRTENNYHVFSLPFAHPGHEHFKGCSGAPILSNTGSLVALVCRGCKQTNELWGISVKAYKTPIDILVGNIK